MGKRLIAMLTAAVICVTLCLAADPDGSLLTPVAAQENQPEPDTQASTEASTEATTEATTEQTTEAATPESTETTQSTEQVVQDDGGPIDFTDIKDIVKANNLTIKANQYTYDSIQGVNNNYLMMSLERSRNSIESLTNSLSTAYAMVISVEKTTDDSALSTLAGAMQENLGATIGLVSANVGQIQSQLASITDNAEDAKDAKERSEKQFEYVADQLAMGAETLYISLNSLDLQQKDLQRNLNTLDRTINEMQQRVKLGQVAEIQLLQLQNQRKQLATGIETLKYNIGNLKGDLSLLLGRESDTSLQLYALPEPTLPARDLEADLKNAITANYDLYFSQLDLDDAADFSDYVGNPRDDAYTVRVREVESLQNKYEAAKINYESSEKSLTQSFQKLYTAIDEAQRQLDLAEDTANVQKRLYETAQTKYERGMISKNSLLSTKDDYEAAQSTLKAKKLDLFSAINQYQWALNGVIA